MANLIPYIKDYKTDHELVMLFPNNDMADKLKALLASYPLVDITAMGFPTNWGNEQLWQ